MNRILTFVLASALLCGPAFADTLGEMRAKYGITRGFNASDKPVPMDVSNADLFLADVTISVRTVGATGTMYAVATSQSTQATSFALRAPQAAALSNIDTTASIALTVSAVWSTESANACSLQQFIVTKN